MGGFIIPKVKSWKSTAGLMLTSYFIVAYLQCNYMHASAHSLTLYECMCWLMGV